MRLAEHSMQDYIFTSESVTEGHPDKVCDRIADAVLDDILRSDPQAHVACEVAANTGLVFVFGEISTSHYCRVDDITRRVLAAIGYDGGCGFSAQSCAVITAIKEQSAEIRDGVRRSLEQRGGAADPYDAQGAGDQGLMFGYACTESERVAPGSYMPLPALLAHQLAARLAQVRHAGTLPELRPDGKTQVSVRYTGGVPQAVSAVLISTQHSAGATPQRLRGPLLEQVVHPVIPAALRSPELDGAGFLCNPSGSFVFGGPEADSGLTGRKIIVDTYGGMARHGGGSFSGKDPSKVDRSAAYYARYAAKNLVAAGAAERLELQVSYAIGQARPVSLSLQCFGTARVEEARLQALLESSGLFDFRPRAIIDQLDLRRPLYEPLSAYGHFGRVELDLPWERLDRADAIRSELGL
jgi:S-adenosylmethionine synthetase